MKFFLEELPVLFPYEYIYPEQYSYMLEIKKTLDAKGHCVLEMPSGTGKTVSLLSLLVSYKMFHPETGKIIYCSRTVPEIEKALAELKNLMQYRQKELGHQENLTAIGLTSRRNLCVHEEVSKHKKGKTVDAECRKLTASWVREKAENNPQIELCGYFEKFYSQGREEILPPGAYTLEDLKAYCKRKGWCPYFMSRYMVNLSNIIIYSYHYLLDPKIAEMVSKELAKDCIVIFDEAHNIDNVCIESMSVDITGPILESSSRCLSTLSRTLQEMKESDAKRLQSEYQKLVEGLREQNEYRMTDQILSNPVLPDDVLQESVPGNIRKAEHFISFLKRFVEYLKMRMKTTSVVSETPATFLQSIRDTAQIAQKPLRFCHERLASLIRTLELSDLEDFTNLERVTSFATLVATYQKGFVLILEPFDDRTATIHDPIFHLS